jgi:hypothetical protein
MPTTELPTEPEEDPRFKEVLERSRHAIGASDRMPVRVIILVALIATCVTLSPTPVNIIGIVATVLLALDIATHRR